MVPYHPYDVPLKAALVRKMNHLLYLWYDVPIDSTLAIHLENPGSMTKIIQHEKSRNQERKETFKSNFVKREQARIRTWGGIS